MSESRWGDLKKRILFSIGIIASVFFLIFFSQILWMRAVVAIVILGVIGVAATELAHLGSAKEKSLSSSWIAATSVFLGASFFSLFSIPLFSNTAPLCLFFCGASLLSLEFFKNRGRVDPHLFFSFFPYLRGPAFESVFFYPLFFLFRWKALDSLSLTVTKMGDIGAYFGGKLLGKKKLAPLLSPKKTCEGAIAGGLLSICASLLFSRLSHHYGWEGFDLSWKESLILGALISLSGQLGDLAESLLKRDAKIKDSSCFPGLGGMLDMTDSLLFVQFRCSICFYYLDELPK